MKKVRINELARELEVKPHAILELLPEFGVSERKTHSSSIDEDVAELIKARLAGSAAPMGVRAAVPRDDWENPSVAADVSAGFDRAAEPEVELSVAAPQTLPEALVPPVPRAPEMSPPAPVAEVPPLPAAEGPPAVEASSPAPPTARPLPLRPPVGGRPIQPPVGGAVPAPTIPAPSAPPAPAQTATPPVPPPAVVAPPPVPSRPASPSAPPIRPPAAQFAPGVPSPRPAPAPSTPATPSARTPAPAPGPGAPRPGQILTGARPGAPPAAPPPRAMQPGQPIARPPLGRPQPPQPPRSAGPAPGAQPPSQQTGSAGRPLAGQPAARPVVPPRPDLVEKLRQQTPARATPGQPQARPAPGRPSPTPGQPIYRGPIRPGQPLWGPGQPGGRPGGPGGPGRGPRPLHPTAPPPPPPTDTRRHAAKPARPAPRDLELEMEGKLRPSGSRRQEQVQAVNKDITIAEGVTVKELADKLGIKANFVIKKLVEKKIFATINQTLDVKLAEDLAREFGAATSQMSYEEESEFAVELAEDPKDLQRRAPVVTIMGHVDHGKTSLLDAIRLANVAEKEAGGITQHIGAYYVEKNGQKIVFIDTPGHEAFTRMRARGAQVTDIVILVVAADDGVMPQTLEAIDHARAAKVPIIVAINKIDKPDAQPERIKQQLADRNLLAEDWGGDTVMVPVSAKSKQNLDLLLEMILLVSDMKDLKANPTRPAVGSVLEAQLDRGRGPVATVLVRNGLLRVGDYFICGSVFGKVRAMFDDRGNPLREAEPSMPVEVLGLESLPEVGDTFQVVTDTAKAKQIVLYRESKTREAAMAKTARVSLEALHGQLKEGETKELNVILKADVGGTAEVLTDTLQKLSTDKVKVRVLHAGVGAITESDVLLATTSEAIIVGFNVRAERTAVSVAEQEKVDIRFHTIIYELTDEIKKAMTGMLEPVFKEVYRGRAEVREVFRISKVGNVAGCMVLDGTITRDSQVRLLRDNVVVFTGRVDSLKRFKNDASEVKSGFECGITLAGYNDVKPGDVIEAFATERVSAEALV
ncbi:MAG: translation initiation factor IF-2 [Bryobacteraceae bacterium]|nr:translation initiation factor IF-2 [Bryobacteraceae bacterium]